MKNTYISPFCRAWEIKPHAIICTSPNDGLSYDDEGGAGKPISEDDIINGGSW